MNKTETRIFESFRKLKTYCEKENFRGWDPYDGLESRIFKALPLQESRFFRLAWIQFFKRSPVNLRRLFGVPKQLNPKGLALFLSAYCLRQNVSPSAENLQTIRFLAKKIIGLQSTGWSGACWGYPFDWQARAFFQPKATPTVVATSFVGGALLDAYQTDGQSEWLDVAASSANFILKDLNRSYGETDAFAFSYSPLDRTEVFNATLLASRLLARIHAHTQAPELLEAARQSIEFCVKHQQSDGAWVYGTLPYHNWIDSFHTGYNLESIAEYQRVSGDSRFEENLKKGFEFYIQHFFSRGGIPKYFHNSVFPVDVHSPGQLLVTLQKTGRFWQHKALAEKVLAWVLDNMQAGKGYFYFQKKKYFTTKIPYMRWAQAWMFLALSIYVSETEAKRKNEHKKL